MRFTIALWLGALCFFGGIVLAMKTGHAQWLILSIAAPAIGCMLAWSPDTRGS